MPRMTFGFYERAVAEVFRQLVKPGMVVLDVGANVGYFSLYLSDLVGPTGMVVAFEPIPEVHSALERNLRRNGATNVEARQVALMDQDKNVRIYVGASAYQASLDVGVAGIDHGSIEVAGSRLDTFASTLERPIDFIKMDVEGGARYALQGSERTIREQRPILIVECHSSEEEHMIGEALTWGDHVVYRVGEPEPVSNLQGDHYVPGGIYGCILAIPTHRLATYPDFEPGRIQRKSWPF